MHDGLVFSSLIFLQDEATARLVEQHGTAWLDNKVFSFDLLTIDHGQGHTVCQDRAEFFHQVKGQSWAAWSISVQEADGGIQAGGFARPADIGQKKCIEKREQGVNLVTRWSSRTCCKCEVILLGQDKVIKNGKVTCAGLPFQSPNKIERYGTVKKGNCIIDMFDDPLEVLDDGEIVLFTGSSAKESPIVRNLAENDCPGNIG
jgi:hypothetical protein